MDVIESATGMSVSGFAHAAPFAGPSLFELCDYVNAHGTGSVIEDALETKAVKAVFGNHAYKLSLSSTKSMHGHLLGAAAAIEAIACIKAMEAGLMPPTLGLDESDSECDLDYVPHTARRKTMAYTMSNTSALGGFAAAIVFGPPPERTTGARILA